nr:hypothetical protein B0A51_18431 [Rachicladosporium sp. CCFEE 5018]
MFRCQRSSDLETPSATSKTAAYSHLLSLPSELRIEIYTLALTQQAAALPLLTTSHAITMEAIPLLFARSLTFASQQKLLAWTPQHSPANLNSVRDLTLRLADIDLSPVLAGTIKGGVWSSYASHLAELSATLRHLPSLEKLTVVPPRNLHSTLLRGFYITLLSMLTKLWPRLKLLILHDDEDILRVVPSLGEVAQVEFVPTAKFGSGVRKGRALRPSSKERKGGSERVDSPMAEADSSDASSQGRRMEC